MDGADEGDDLIGRVVEGRYRILERIGHGGMGIVYRVEHVRMGKVAALKMLHRDLAADREAGRRFRREAQAVAALNHPCIVQTFDFGHFAGRPYLVMEYLHGDDLGAILKREGRMPFARAAPMFRDVCAALGEAHDAGIVHRDLKPENIMCVKRREGVSVKVLDFGLAKLRERQELAEITSRDSLVGTPYYMSPEQVRSEPLDARSDIYSLGATLYRMLTGVPPFEAATPMGVLTAHLTESLRAPSARAPSAGISAEVDAIVMRAMARERGDRFSTAAEMARQIERVEKGLPDEPLPASTTSARLAESRLRARPETGEVSADDRLRREDFDAFERSLRRRKVVSSLILPVLVLGGALALWRLEPWAEGPQTEESEPNGSPASATPVGLRSYVHGALGPALASGQPDLDYYRVALPKDADRIKVRLEPVPGVDMLVEVFDESGESLGRENTKGPGEREEWSSPTLEAKRGTLYVLVREVWVEGQAPTVRPDDHYALYVED